MYSLIDPVYFVRGLQTRNLGKSLVIHDISASQRRALIETVRESYMEIFPTATIESKLDVLEPNSYVAVTCSPTKGVDATLAMAERLAVRGFKVVPHIAARMVRDKAHLREIIKRLDDTPIVSLFVPGGDSERPAGDYDKALDLLRDIADIDHKFTEVGIAGHPEGHPIASDEELIEQLLKKQEYANYIVTQMCFDAGKIKNWLLDIRSKGVELGCWLGLPGAADRNSLIKTSLRIGVGDSVRYLKRQARNTARLMASKKYKPDDLLFQLAPIIADPDLKIAGHHVYCFNLVERCEKWRHGFLEEMSG
jgi:methylenetetrahydrofolate reductase (NADPH)